MKNKATVNLLRKIKSYLSFFEFELMEEQFKALSEKELEAFWFIYSSGYPAGFALSNCRNIYNYTENKNITYKEALKIIYSIYPGLVAGIHIKHKEWFELN